MHSFIFADKFEVLQIQLYDERKREMIHNNAHNLCISFTSMTN